MNIYYNLDKQVRCDEFGLTLSNATMPQLRFKEQPQWTLHIIRDDGSHADLSRCNAFRAAVDVDYSAETTPLIRTLNDKIDKAQKADGILSIPMDTNTVTFADAIANVNGTKNAYFELWGLDENAIPVMYVMFQIKIANVIDPDGGEPPVDVESDYATMSEFAAVIAAGDEIQFTANTASESAAHTTQTDSDTHYRFRNAVAQGDWSPWIKLPKGVKGDTGAAGKDGVSVDNVEQTTTSTESGGTNVITVTFSDGKKKSFNVWNGAQGEKGDTGEKGATGDAFHFDAIGTLAEKDAYNDEAAGFAYLDTENGNIYIKNSETSADWTDPIPFRGERGSDGVSITSVEQTTTSTASEGTNVITVTLSDGQTFSFNVKNGAAGKTGEKGDAGTPGVQGPAGENGLTPYIGTNKNWWVGTEDTGVLAEGSNLFANGVPPFEFTAADLTDGILSRTFTDLGIDSALPVSVNIIDGNGVIMDGDVRLAMIWTETGLDVDLTQFEAVNGTWKLVFAGGTNGTSGGSGSGNGYLRSFTAASLTAQSGGWYIATASDITITLPSGNTGRYVRISTTATANNVVIAPASGATIDGDSEGLTIDKTSGTTELFWNGTGWIVIEAK